MDSNNTSHRARKPVLTLNYDENCPICRYYAYELQIGPNHELHIPYLKRSDSS